MLALLGLHDLSDKQSTTPTVRASPESSVNTLILVGSFFYGTEGIFYSLDLRLTVGAVLLHFHGPRVSLLH
jgi:hypothetical protein